MTDLNKYISANLNTPFEWGKHDCVLFAAGWIHLKTGVDYLVHYPKWNNRREALVIIGNHDQLRAMVIEHLGQPAQKPSGDGNIALLREGKGGLAVTCGPYVVGPSTTHGLGFMPFTEATDFWTLP